MRTIQVMIVDDHAIVIEALEQLLKTDRRLEVRARARSLSESRQLLTRFTPDVILLDLRLPDSQGEATITAIRSCSREARIIVLTGSSDVTERQARRSGADAYLDKQTESSKIVDTILNVASLNPRAGTPMEALSPRELQVARLAAEGMANAGIARALHVSEDTIHTHIAHILAKLRIRNRTELAALWHSRRSEPQ